MGGKKGDEEKIDGLVTDRARDRGAAVADLLAIMRVKAASHMYRCIGNDEGVGREMEILSLLTLSALPETVTTLSDEHRVTDATVFRAIVLLARA